MKKLILAFLGAMVLSMGLCSHGAGIQDTFVWTKREPAGAGVTKYWSAVAMNSDGTKLVACAQKPASGVGGDYVYTSTDGGASWVKRSPAGTNVPKFWYAAAMSSDGSKIAVCADYVYTSSNGGTTWAKRGAYDNWYSVAMSSDGTRLTACAFNDYVYTSINSGSTWTKREPAGAGATKQWYSVAMSSDGTKITAVAYDDYVYTSIDGGAHWTVREPAGSGVPEQWGSVAMTSDGTGISACTEGSFLVFTSTDSGGTWTQSDPSSGVYFFGSAVAMNSTGTKIIACPLDSDYIYNSSDGGANWLESSPAGVGQNKDWYSIAMSADGRRVAACAHDPDFVYTATSNKQINFVAGANGSLEGNSSQSVTVGEDCTPVTAVPAANYHFVEWTGDGGFTTTSANPLTVTNITEAMTITANFAHDQGTITTEVVGSGTINVVAGPYDTMTKYDISATEGGGYTFINFSVYGDAELDATTSPTQFQLTGLNGCSAKITANFLSDANIVTPDPSIGDTDTFARINGIVGESKVYKVLVPAGTTRMIISTTGVEVAGEDCDIYISPHVIPTLESFYAKSTGPTISESITVLNPEAEPTEWYVLLYGYAAFNAVDLNISVLNDVPERPNLISASDDLAGSVHLIWEIGPLGAPAVSYDIYRSKDNSPDLTEFLKNVDGGASTSTDDDTAQMGTHYYYWVRSRSGTGDNKSSDFSNSRQGWIDDGTPVKDLSNGVAVSKISGTIGTTRRFTFTVPVLSPVAKLLEIRTSGGTGDCDLSVEQGGQVLVYGVKATNNETVRIENPSGTYDIILYANTDYSGLSLRAKCFNATPPAPTLPLASDGTYADSILISWTASEGASSYEVWRGTSNVSSMALKIAEVSDNSYIDISNSSNLLDKDLTYYYWIKALNGLGTSKFSAYNSGYISRIPNPPSSFTASKLKYFDKITLSWSTASGATSYRIYRNTSGVFNELDLLATVPYDSLTKTYAYDDLGAADPKPGTPYYYWVKAQNDNGKSDSRTDTGTIRTVGPSGVTASDGTFYDKVKITWTAVAGATEYEIWYSSTDDVNTAAQYDTSASPVTSSEYYDEGVVGKTYYWIKAKYINTDTLDEYTSDFSLSDGGYPKDTVNKVATPSLKSVSNGSSDKVSITWGEVPTATSYTVYRRISSSDLWVAVVGASNIAQLSFNDGTGDVGQIYMYCVKAFNDPLTLESSLSASKTGYRAGASTEFKKGDPAVFETNPVYKSEKIFYIDVPAGMSRLVAKVENGTGNCDLFAKLDSYPTTKSYYAKGKELTGGGKTLTVTNPAEGRWYILLYGADAAGYVNVQFSATYYGATGIFLTAVPADDQTVPFTAAFKGVIQDETGTAIAGLVVGVRDPLTGLTKWLTKSDSKGNFSYSTQISADGEYTFDFYLTTIPDSTLDIASWTVRTRRNPGESNGLFDFSGYLAGTRVPDTTLQTQAGALTPIDALAGLEEYMNIRRGFTNGPLLNTDYEDIWLTNTVAAAADDVKIISKLDEGLYLLYYGTEGTAVGNGPSTAPAGLVASPLLVRVATVKQAAAVANLKANGLIDNVVADNLAGKGVGVVVISAVSNPAEIGIDYDYDVSLYANEQLELLANIAMNSDVAPNLVTPEKKYGTAGTIAKFVNVTIDGGTRKIGIAASCFLLEKSNPVP